MTLVRQLVNCDQSLQYLDTRVHEVIIKWPNFIIQQLRTLYQTTFYQTYGHLQNHDSNMYLITNMMTTRIMYIKSGRGGEESYRVDEKNSSPARMST